MIAVSATHGFSSFVLKMQMLFACRYIIGISFLFVSFPDDPSVHCDYNGLKEKFQGHEADDTWNDFDNNPEEINEMSAESYYDSQLAAETVESLPKRYRRKNFDGESESRCVFCLEFVNDSNYLDHLMEKHSRPQFKMDAMGKAKCIDCDFAFENLWEVEEHVHYEHGKLYCIYCHKFLPVAYHKVHMRVKHSNIPRYRCFFCPRLYDLNSLLEKHMQEAHGEDFIAMNKMVKGPNSKVCRICGFHDDDRFTYANHMIKKHNEVICPLCQIPFERLLDMRRHTTWIHKGDPLASCFTCRLNFKTKKDCSEHQAQDHPKKAMVCVSFSKKRTRRLIGKDGSVLPRCPICFQDFDTEDYFFDHLQVAHRPKFAISNSKPESLACPELDCNYSIPDAEVLESHIKLKHCKVYCIYCKKYLLKKDMGKHCQYVHAPLPTNFCVYCPRIVMNVAQLEDHVAKVHSGAVAKLQLDPDCPGNVLCYMPDCTFTSPKRLAFFSHLVIDHERNCCPVCLQQFTRLKQMKEHIRSRHRDHNYHFCRCGSIFHTEQEKDEHIKVDHFNKPVEKKFNLCDLCGKSFTTESSLHKHKNMCGQDGSKHMLDAELPPKHPKLFDVKQNEDKMFACPEEGCHVTKPQRSKLEKHFNTAHNSQVCPYCKKVYSYFSIREHIAFQHTGKTNRLQCPECPEMFYNVTYLRRHKDAVHMTHINFPCSVCGEVFPTKRKEINHRSEKHTRKRLNPCPVCHKNFRSSTLLQPHCDAEHPGFIVPKDLIKIAW